MRRSVTFLEIMTQNKYEVGFGFTSLRFTDLEYIANCLSITRNTSVRRKQFPSYKRRWMRWDGPSVLCQSLHFRMRKWLADRCSLLLVIANTEGRAVTVAFTISSDIERFRLFTLVALGNLRRDKVSGIAFHNETKPKQTIDMLIL